MNAPMLKYYVTGCHGNHAIFHSVIEFIFEAKVFAFLGSI